MLAQNFLTAADLGLRDIEHAALVRVLGMLERGELRHHPWSPPWQNPLSPRSFCGLFNMSHWAENTECGTVACIGGTAELIGGFTFSSIFDNHALDTLFYPPRSLRYEIITPAQAAAALRNYLTHGAADWPSAVAATTADVP